LFWNGHENDGYWGKREDICGHVIGTAPGLTNTFIPLKVIPVMLQAFGTATLSLPISVLICSLQNMH
jgi:hypothetical protein